MKRLTKQRLQKEFDKAKSKLGSHWNDAEIRIDGRYYGNFFTDDVGKAFEEWKSIKGSDYKRIGVTLNMIDKNGDIQDVNWEFEHEVGI